MSKPRSVPIRVESVTPASPASRFLAPSSIASAATVARFCASWPKRRMLAGSAMSSRAASFATSASRGGSTGSSATSGVAVWIVCSSVAFLAQPV